MGLAFGQHGHRGVIAVQSLGGEDVCLDPLQQRLQHGASGADLISERRQGDRHAFPRVALDLPVQRLVLPTSRTAAWRVVSGRPSRAT